MSPDEKQPTQEQAFEGLPIRITIEAGAGLMHEGGPLGRAQITFAHDVGKNGLCPHHVTLEVISLAQPVVTAALLEAIAQAKEAAAAAERSGAENANSHLDA